MLDYRLLCLDPGLSQDKALARDPGEEGAQLLVWWGGASGAEPRAEPTTAPYPRPRRREPGQAWAAWAPRADLDLGLGGCGPAGYVTARKPAGPVCPYPSHSYLSAPLPLPGLPPPLFAPAAPYESQLRLQLWDALTLQRGSAEEREREGHCKHQSDLLDFKE